MPEVMSVFSSSEISFNTALRAADIGRDAIPVKNTMLDEGVIIRGVGEGIIWCPPLVVTDEEIGRYIETLQKALA